MKKILIVGFLSIIFMLLIQPALAVSFSPHHNWPMQTVNSVQEEVFLNLEGLEVNFKGSILVDRERMNGTDWLTFDFSPSFNNYKEKVTNFSYSIMTRTNGNLPEGLSSVYHANYTELKSNNSLHTYNVSLNSLPRSFWLDYEANYTLIGTYTKIGDSDYSSYFISQIDTKYQSVSFFIPNNFQIMRMPDGGEMQGVSTHQLITYSGDQSKKFMYFTFHYIDEQKEIDGWQEIKYLVLGAFTGSLFGLIITLVYNHFTSKHQICKDAEIKRYEDHDIITLKIGKK